MSLHLIPIYVYNTCEYIFPVSIILDWNFTTNIGTHIVVILILHKIYYNFKEMVIGDKY